MTTKQLIFFSIWFILLAIGFHTTGGHIAGFICNGIQLLLIPSYNLSNNVKHHGKTRAS